MQKHTTFPSWTSSAKDSLQLWALDLSHCSSNLQETACARVCTRVHACAAVEALSASQVALGATGLLRSPLPMIASGCSAVLELL